MEKPTRIPLIIGITPRRKILVSDRSRPEKPDENRKGQTLSLLIHLFFHKNLVIKITAQREIEIYPVA